MDESSPCVVLHLAATAPTDYLPGAWDVLARAMHPHGIVSHFALTTDVPSAFVPTNGLVHRLPSLRGWRLDTYRAWLRLIREIKPKVIQVWGPNAMGLGLAARSWFRGLKHLFVAESGLRMNRWWARLLRYNDSIVIGTAAHREVHSILERRGCMLEVIPPHLPFEEPPDTARDPLHWREIAGVPGSARLVIAVGPLEPGFGAREAIWIFDILKYTDPNLWLVVVGDGSLRRSLQDFAQALGHDDVRVKFLGWRSDIVDALRAADLIWLLGSRGGLGMLQTAAALGIPLVARHRADYLETAPSDFQRQYVPHADKHQVAKASRAILERGQMAVTSSSGFDDFGARFATKHIVSRWLDVYRKLLGEAVVPR